MAPGAHVVEYRSTDGAGNAEAPKSAPVRVTIREEQTNPLISFTGPWFITNHANLSGGSTKQVSALGAAATIVFNGTRLDWVTSRAASYGKARVIVDCGTPVEVDLYSASSQFKQTVFSTGDLQSGDHTLRIEYTGTKNASSSGNTIGLDALDVTGRLLQADRTAPVTTITAPTTWQSKSATVSLAAVDDLSGVQAIYFRLIRADPKPILPPSPSVARVATALSTGPSTPSATQRAPVRGRSTSISTLRALARMPQPATPIRPPSF